MTVDETKWQRLLARRKIPRGQVTLLKVLYEADGFVAESEIVDRIRSGDWESFRGVVGAFSNRVNETLGFREEKPGISAVVERETVDGARRWRLREPMREAIESFPELVEELERPLEALLDDDGFELEGPDPELADRGGRHPFELRFGTWNVDAFQNSQASHEEKIEFLAERFSEDSSVVALQEVTRPFYRQLVESGLFDWEFFSLLHRRPGRAEGKNRRLGCMLAGNFPLEPLSVEVLDRLPLPERSMVGAFELHGTEFVAASLHSVTGVGYGATKVAAFRVVVDWLLGEEQPTIFGIDANTPKLDHPDHESTEYWKQGEKPLFGPEAPHDMRDAARSYLQAHPKDLRELEARRPEGPIATTYMRSQDTPCRYDRIYHSPGFEVATISHEYDEAKTARSDHALVVSELKYVPATTASGKAQGDS